MFTTKKIAVVSVINDLVTDGRVNKACIALIESGYDVVLIGRKLPGSLPVPASWPFRSVRMNLLFKQGPAFYLFFNLRLFVKLLFTKADLLYANDLDTLLANYLASRIKKLPLIYDSHELYCDVPELMHTPFKRSLWQKLEGWIVPKLKHCITVNDSIAAIFTGKYKVPFQVVRNIPDVIKSATYKSREELGLPSDKKVIILQGAGINIDRGAEELVDAMPMVNDAVLLIIGSGDVWHILEEKVKALKLEDKVRLIRKIPKAELMSYTRAADLGLSIDKNTNPNYYYSLPNKIFDYIHAGLPVLTSHLPEIESIVRQFHIGDFIPDHQPQSIAAKINSMLASPELAAYRRNTVRAAEQLSWSSEKERLLKVIRAAAPSV